MNDLTFYDSYDNDRKIVIPQRLFDQIVRKGYDRGEFKGLCAGAVIAAAYIIASCIADDITASGRRKAPEKVYYSYNEVKKDK